MKTSLGVAALAAAALLGTGPALAADPQVLKVGPQEVPGLVGPAGLYASPRMSAMVQPKDAGDGPGRQVDQPGTNQVPVPAPLALLGIGAVALALVGRSKRR